MIEISGNSAPMRIETDPARGSAKAQMPCPLKIDELSVGLGNYPVVVFEGIVHLITEKKMPEPDDLKKCFLFCIRNMMQKPRASCIWKKLRKDIE